MVVGTLASAVLVSLYAGGGAGWPLGFVALVPWLLALDTVRCVRRTLLGAWAMSVAFAAAALPWFGAAIGRYTQIGEPAGVALLLAAAPLLQPQFFGFALVRSVVGRSHGPLLTAFAAAAAWVATERLVPKLLGDTLGHGLYPSLMLRQAADLGGTAGLTALLLLANEGVAGVLRRRHDGLLALLSPLALAALVPLLLAVYGAATLATLPEAGGSMLRMGLVQSNIVDYERLRAERGAGAAVREILDVHYTMSYDAVERQHVDAVLWSETVYPTTFGKPKSEAGAGLDREILGIVDAAGVPFVFGTYDRDEGGEYNAAAFVAPGTGLVALYRKSRPFPLTEFVPQWLDGPLLRGSLPWAGSWRPGTGARAFPLQLRDGREIPVLPLICLDTMDSALVVDGARLGAAVILNLSNDSWFGDRPQGAELHLAAAAMRSVETRLPQFRVTSNGYSAVIDATGTVQAGTRFGERTLVVGELPVREPLPTLWVRWGDWVGLVGAAFLALLALMAAWRRWGLRVPARAPTVSADAVLPADAALLPAPARIAAGALRAIARGGLLVMAAAVWFGDGPIASNTLAQLRTFAIVFLAPEAVAALILRAFAARVSVQGDALVFSRGARRLELRLREIAAVEAWRLPLPGFGVWLRLASGERWRYGISPLNARAFAAALEAAGVAVRVGPAAAATYAQAALSARRCVLDRPWVKFGLLSLLLALPAFRLHQHIAYGGTLGEYLSFGLAAYLKGFALWWAAWAIGVLACAAVLRTATEAGTMLVVVTLPARAGDVRRWLEQGALVVLYLGLPVWLLLRLLSN